MGEIVNKIYLKRGARMIKGFINPLHADKVITDLGGYEAVAEYREGVLIDSMLFYTTNIVVALMEHPTSRNESLYRVEIAPEGSKEAQKIERYFTMSYTLD